MTPYFQDPFLHGYENQPVNDLIVTLKVVVEKQKGHAAFQGELSEYVTRWEPMTALIGRIETARGDAMIGNDPVKLALLDALVAEGVKALRFNAHHVVMVSSHRNDSNLLQGAGYDFKPHPAAKEKVNLLDLVPELDAKLGPVAGSVIVIVKKRPNSKASMELQCSDNPGDEQSWRATGEGTYNSSRIELRGLEPVKRIYIRGRFHEAGAVGRWSSPINIIVH